MARSIFENFLTDLRFLLHTETDADSPDNVLLRNGIRHGIERLLALVVGIAGSGTFTSDPSNDTNGYFYDSAAGWEDDQHNGKTLIICSGNGIGNKYTIDDMTASTNQGACTGDNLYSDGVRSGDEYIIVYDILTESSGHTHDGVNSPWVDLVDGKVGALPIDHEDGTEYSHTYASWESLSSTWKIYVPANAKYLRCKIRASVSSGDNAYIRFNIGGSNTSNEVSPVTGYTWIETELYLDIESAGLSGLQDLCIEGSTNGTVYLKGFTFWWANS